ncbi:MAG: 16S rRNA (guanine(966)-N(2))-methyltransferase RsmD [Rhodospirillales bacterium]|nr:16S rRNA (guanine(966)-N(2))-methyltransferase RsmD [Rhodospirillales bacterium]
MRIIGGTHKGRSLLAPPGQATRPTSGRVRESVFNILAHGFADLQLAETSVVDVFAGTGALGLEALSRGALHATFIDTSRSALEAAKKNAATLGEWRKAMTLKADASQLAMPPRAAKAPCGLAFLDAPYEKELSLPALLGLVNKGWVHPGAVVVVELAAKEELELPRRYQLLDERSYGAARVLFLQVRS